MQERQKTLAGMLWPGGRVSASSPECPRRPPRLLGPGKGVPPVPKMVCTESFRWQEQSARHAQVALPPERASPALISPRKHQSPRPHPEHEAH